MLKIMGLVRLAAPLHIEISDAMKREGSIAGFLRKRRNGQISADKCEELAKLTLEALLKIVSVFLMPN